MWGSLTAIMPIARLCGLLQSTHLQNFLTQTSASSFSLSKNIYQKILSYFSLCIFDSAILT